MKSLQHQYDGQFRSHVHALQDECRDHVRQEEDKLRKELQQALTQESSMCRDQLHQTLRQQIYQEEYADEITTREIDQLRLKVTEQEHAFPHQQEEYAHKQHTLFHEFDGALKDRDFAVQTLKQKLANHKEQTLVELEQAYQDIERMAHVQRPVYADGLSTQPYAAPVEKKTRIPPPQRDPIHSCSSCVQLSKSLISSLPPLRVVSQSGCSSAPEAPLVLETPHLRGGQSPVYQNSASAEGKGNVCRQS